MALFAPDVEPVLLLAVETMAPLAVTFSIGELVPIPTLPAVLIDRRLTPASSSLILYSSEPPTDVE